MVANFETMRAPIRIDGSGPDWSSVRGFNYQPSYGRTGLEIWSSFDAEKIAVELDRGVTLFPRMNTLRLWLSWESYKAAPTHFMDNLERLVSMSAARGCGVIPVLFNRWHRGNPDFGGVYLDHILPAGFTNDIEEMDRYLEAVIGRYRDDARILAWDLCNEPFFDNAAYNPEDEGASADVVACETEWLRRLYAIAKKAGSVQPCTVGAFLHVTLERMNEFSDVLSVKTYLLPETSPDAGQSRGRFIEKLDAYVAFAKRVRKPLVASECCWGSLDDKERGEMVRNTLAALKERGVGWTAHLLHHSLVADAHRPEWGPVGPPGYMAFIESDGSLRPHHEIFNEF